MIPGVAPLLDVYGNPVSYDEVTRVQRDILLVFHQSLEHRGLGACWKPWDDLFDLPYWRFAGLVENPEALRPETELISDEDLQLVRGGSLIVILDMLLDQALKPDECVAPRVPHCAAALARFQPRNAVEGRLRDAVQAAVAAVDAGEPNERLYAEAQWAWVTCVKGYYLRVVAQHL